MFGSMEEAHKMHREHHTYAEGRIRQFDEKSEYFTAHKDRINWITSRIMLGSKLLDIGCSAGEFSHYLTHKRGCSCDGIDVNEESVNHAPHDVDIICGTAENLPYEDNSYQVVLMSEVLEHFYEPDITLMEAFRVLKPNGIIIGSVPHVDSPIIKDKPAWKYSFHMRDFSEYELASYLDSYFEDVEIEPIYAMYQDGKKHPFWWVFKGVKDAEL